MSSRSVRKTKGNSPEDLAEGVSEAVALLNRPESRVVLTGSLLFINKRGFGLPVAKRLQAIGAIDLQKVPRVALACSFRRS